MASNDNNVTMNFGADISELKKGIQEAQRHIRLANAEFKAAASGMDDWDKSADGINKKLKQLGDVLKNQKTILENYERQLELVQKEQGENSKGAEDLKIKIEYQKAAINKTTKEIEDWNESLKHVDDEVEEVGDDLDKTTNGGLSAFAVALGNLAANIISDAISKLKDLAKQTIQVGQDFDTSMSKVAALSGATEEELSQLRDTAKDWGSKTRYSATEAADAIGYMSLAGWDAQTSMDALGGVLNLAASANMDLAEASDIVTDYMSAFNLEAKDSAKFADIMAFAQANANTNVEQLAGAFKNCAANMNAAGQDVETVTSLLAMMANQGLKGEKAGTALSAVMRDITNNMESASFSTGGFVENATKLGYNAGGLLKVLNDLGVSNKEFDEAMKECDGDTESFMESLQSVAKKGADVEGVFKKAGITSEDLGKIFGYITDNAKQFEIGVGDTEVAITDANGKYRDMTDILADIEGALEGMEDGERSAALGATFTADSIKGLNLLLNAGSDDAAAFEESLRDCGGSAEDMANVMQDNLGGDLTAFKSKLEGTQIAIYEKFEPALRSAVDTLSGMLDGVNNLVDHSGEIIAFFEKLAPIVVGVATALGTFLLIVKKAAIVAALTKAITAVKAAFVGLGAVLAANPIGIVVAAIAGLVAAFVVLWNKSEAFRQFWIDLWENIKAAASAAWENIKAFFADAWAGIQELWASAQEFFSAIWEGIKEIFTGAWEAIVNTWGAIVDFFTGLWEGIKEVFSTVAQWINDNVFQPIINFFKPVITFFTEAWTIIKQLAEGCWNAIKLIWKQVKEWFNTNVVKPVKAFFTELWNSIKEAASAAWDFIKGIWAAVSGWFDSTVIKPVAGFFSSLWEGIQSAAGTAWDFIKGVWDKVSSWFNDNVVTPVTTFFTTMWEGLKTKAGEAWEGIKEVFGHVTDWFKDTFSKAWQAVKDVFSTGGKIFDGIKEGIVSAFKVVVNGIIKAINKIIAIPFNAINETLDKIRNIEIAGAKPFAGVVKKFTVPVIPELASGGVLKRGQVGLLEGNGAEAVIPLENNKKWIAATAKALKTAMIGEGLVNVAGRETITNNYNFVQNNTSPKALSRLEIYRQTNNQLQFARGI